MATVAELIEETRRILFSGAREERNKLSADVSTTATSFPMTYALGGIRTGAKLSLDLEDVYVWNTSGSNANPVERAQWGSAAATHASGTIVNVNPKFSNWEIFNALNDELASLSSPQNGLYRMATIEITSSPVVSGYNIPDTNIIDIYEVRYAVPGPGHEWPLSRDWELSSQMPTDEFPSGSTLFVRDAFPNSSVWIKAKKPYDSLSASMTHSTTSRSNPLPDSILDILTMGAAWRLTSSREVKRNFTEVQGDTRRAAEVPPGANLGASRELGRIRQQRIFEEAARLRQLYPDRKNRYPYKVGW